MVGNDLGGAMGQTFVISRPDLVRSLGQTTCDTHSNLAPEAFQETMDLELMQKHRGPVLLIWETDGFFFSMDWVHWLVQTLPNVTELVEIEGAKLFLADALIHNTHFLRSSGLRLSVPSRKRFPR